MYKSYVGQSSTADSIKGLLASGDLVPIDSWSEVSLTYEKYEAEDLKRVWSNIVKDTRGLASLDRVQSDGTWGLLYENS